jgi:hypothetical protein
MTVAELIAPCKRLVHASMLRLATPEEIAAAKREPRLGGRRWRSSPSRRSKSPILSGASGSASDKSRSSKMLTTHFRSLPLLSGRTTPGG